MVILCKARRIIRGLPPIIQAQAIEFGRDVGRRISRSFYDFNKSLVPCSVNVSALIGDAAGRVCFWKFVWLIILQDAGKVHRLSLGTGLYSNHPNPIESSTALAPGFGPLPTSSLQPYLFCESAFTFGSSGNWLDFPLLPCNHHCDWSGIDWYADLYIAKKMVNIISNDFPIGTMKAIHRRP